MFGLSSLFFFCSGVAFERTVVEIKEKMQINKLALIVEQILFLISITIVVNNFLSICWTLQDEESEINIDILDSLIRHLNDLLLNCRVFFSNLLLISKQMVRKPVRWKYLEHEIHLDNKTTLRISSKIDAQSKLPTTVLKDLYDLNSYSCSYSTKYLQTSNRLPPIDL